MKNSRDLAVDKLEELRELVDDASLLEYLVYNYLSGADALEALVSYEENE